MYLTEIFPHPSPKATLHLDDAYSSSRSKVMSLGKLSDPKSTSDLLFTLSVPSSWPRNANLAEVPIHNIPKVRSL